MVFCRLIRSKGCDPKTRAPILTIRSLGSMDDVDWKLEDFQ